ncbi:MAG: AAA family ATPase [Rhodoplanes sp.]|nr:AAA family ATPase [Rhodoplanes sp.]
MAGKVITIANMKGGVGKTATVVALAEALAADDVDAKILVIDLDAQANASSCLAGDGPLAALIRDGQTIDGFLNDVLFKRKSRELDAYIRNYISTVTHRGHQLGIALLASSVELRRTETKILYRLTRAKMSLDEIVEHLSMVMDRELGRARRRFDYVLIDCGPGISILTEVTIRLADMVIVPTIPDALSTYGLQAFCNSIWSGELAEKSHFESKPKARSPHVLITRRRQVELHHRFAAMIRNEGSAKRPAFRVYETEIPESADVAKALGSIDEPVPFSRKWGPQVVAVMRNLVDETKEILNVARH